MVEKMTLAAWLEKNFPGLVASCSLIESPGGPIIASAWISLDLELAARNGNLTAALHAAAIADGDRVDSRL